MKTTLKRAMGRGAAVNGNGRAIYPPSAATPMARYRQPDPPRRGAWHLVASIFLWAVLAALIIGAAAGGAAYLKGHQFVDMDVVSVGAGQPVLSVHHTAIYAPRPAT